MYYYDTIAYGYNELHKEEQIKKLKIIKNNLEIKKTDKLLDVGCGTGFSFDYFDCECYGIDSSRELLKHCKDKDAKLILSKAEQLPFSDNFFDVVISITAIHNFNNIEKALKEMKRVGKKNFAFSVLKESKNFKKIEKLIKKFFKIKKQIEEEKDVIFIAQKRNI